ncbi:hypothetical protein TNCV_4481201 [Trichonephila clavipes]|nr:hypothetical protein TNCV_4481201 [Trichonephila clavipes]
MKFRALLYLGADDFSRNFQKNPYVHELAKNGSQHGLQVTEIVTKVTEMVTKVTEMVTKVTEMVTKVTEMVTNMATKSPKSLSKMIPTRLLPRFRQISIESPLQYVGTNRLYRLPPRPRPGRWTWHNAIMPCLAYDLKFPVSWRICLEIA